MFELDAFLIPIFVLVQGLYTATFLVDIYLFTLPVNWVRMPTVEDRGKLELPYIVLFYPVLRELKATMRTTFLSVARLDYPVSCYRVIAIPNASDTETIASLRDLQAEFPFLDILEVPPTTDPSWQVVWNAWEGNRKAYWWHKGRRAHDRNLPPKKTRQLIYAFYRVADRLLERHDFLVNYIDADSCPPPDHFLAAASGIRDFDVLQAQNIAGNLNETLSASWHAFDHMAWDGLKYPHLSASGRQPYWVLGKGLFFKASDLVALGGFHPWITIEDPEVGMRFWTNGKRLGIIRNPLIEEVPSTFAHGITQRKRWVAGFFQSLGTPLKEMGMRPADRVRAWMNFLPCLSLWLNAIGLPIGIWAMWAYCDGRSDLPPGLFALSVLNVVGLIVSLATLYVRTWKRSKLVLPHFRDRILYLLRVNPLFLLAWWLLWLVPLWIGFRMYLMDGGLIWERTVKTDANRDLMRAKIWRGWGGERRPLAPPVLVPLPSPTQPAESTIHA